MTKKSNSKFKLKNLLLVYIIKNLLVNNAKSIDDFMKIVTVVHNRFNINYF